jgi:nanoRNase/pAp phosphatase (c-di-AMP/oligoRNAs hydrolase)
VQGPVILYSPHYQSENLIRELSNIIKDNNIESVIMMKVPAGNNMMKYSIRRGELEIDLGTLLKDMDVGGGNPYAAGCIVRNHEKFEKEFFKRLADLGIE